MPSDADRSGPPALLYFNPNPLGGLADYAHEQANAIVQAGCPVLMVCPTTFQPRSPALYGRVEFLSRGRKAASAPPKLVRAIRMARETLGGWNALARAIEKSGAQRVLLGAYAEYFSPIWSRRFRTMARRGVTFGAVVHDPVRDAVLGPAWWHRWSVQSAYSFLKFVFVHESVGPETLGSHSDIGIFRVPHGPYRLGVASSDRRSTRAALGIPEGAFTLIAFGHIRDNKNLDLAIQALAEFPDAHLIVAGRELSGREKQSGFYMSLADSLGVAGRCHWVVRHVPENEAASLFEASDAVLLNYGSAFKSASGVLAAAVGFRRPCVASSGAGPLRRLVEDYRLGPWVQPDSLSALVVGIRQAQTSGVMPEWERFELENSWERNAAIVLKCFRQSPRHS
jgi:glycosyltransferase involved in cell wall biosynthesis